jgi:hypothetical protein
MLWHYFLDNLVSIVFQICIFGSECRIEYASDCSALAINHQSFDTKKLTIRQVPENVSENDLRHLFVDCHIIKYRPAVTVHLPATTTKSKKNSKILLG